MDKHETNARHIAAASELLAALIIVGRHIAAYTDGDEDIRRLCQAQKVIHAALTKARGK